MSDTAATPALSVDHLSKRFGDLDRLGWRIVSGMFDRERLMTGPGA